MLSLICFLTGPYHATLYCDYERIYFDKEFINEKKYIYFFYLIPCFNCVQLVWKGLNDFDGRQWIFKAVCISALTGLSLVFIDLPPRYLKCPQA